MTTALIADDEPLLRDHLARQLQSLWPELRVVAQARNGREALEQFEQHRPDVAFLDVHMPGGSGIEVARSIGERAHIVFVTAFDRYALEAFERGAIDYLVKPLEDARLAQTVARLRQRSAPPRHDLEPLLEALAGQLRAQAAPRSHLQWIKASIGKDVRLIPVDELVYVRSDVKYTLVVWQQGQTLIRKTIQELADELDPQKFVRVHRSVIVALSQVSRVVRGDNETASIELRGRPEVLPVSRNYTHQFRQM